MVRVEGRIVRENQAQLKAQLEALVEEGEKSIALDFEAVEYMDSAALGCCASVEKRIREKGSGRLVAFGASPNIERMWKIIHLELVIPLFQDQDAALDWLRNHEIEHGE